MATHIGFDTETQRGKAILCATPHADLCFPRKFQDVLDWLATQGETFVAWNANYDIQAILRLIGSEDVLQRLGLTNECRVFDTQLKYIPNKLFEARWGTSCIKIYDLMQFYGGSLDYNATKHLGEGKLPLSNRLRVYLKSGLMGNALRDKVTHEECREYCMIDAKRVEQLGELMETSVTNCGLHFNHPVSCAGLARQRWGSKLAGRLKRKLHEVYSNSYRGGRMEVTRRGRIKDVSCWDIHSAYPAVLQSLPSTDDCDGFTNKKCVHPDAVYGSFYCLFRLPEGAPVYPVSLFHPRGHLFYPFGTFTTWADVDTVRVTQELFGPGSVEVIWSHQFVQVNDAKPFSEMAQMYVDRKASPERNLALKLVMNSTYGLLAEKLKRWVPVKNMLRMSDSYAGGTFYRAKPLAGPGANPALAGKITGATRAKMIRDTWGQEVYSFATDGVIMAGDAEPTGGSGDALGEWGCDGYGDAIIIGSGIYAFRDMYADEPKWRTKSRGFGHLGDLEAFLSKHKMRSAIPISDLRAATLKQYATRKSVTAEEMNYLQRSKRILNLTFDHKRNWNVKKPRARDLLSGNHGSEALQSFIPPDRMKGTRLLR